MYKQEGNDVVQQLEDTLFDIFSYGCACATSKGCSDIHRCNKGMLISMIESHM